MSAIEYVEGGSLNGAGFEGESTFMKWYEGDDRADRRTCAESTRT